MLILEIGVLWCDCLGLLNKQVGWDMICCVMALLMLCENIFDAWYDVLMRCLYCVVMRVM